jgi:hypothetical protein
MLIVLEQSPKLPEIICDKTLRQFLFAESSLLWKKTHLIETY